MKKISTLLVVLIMMLSFGVVVAMATTSQVTVLDGTYTEIYNVTFGADDDTYHRVTHGLGVDPELVSVAAWDANCAAATNSGAAGDIDSAMPFVNDTSSTYIGIGKISVIRSATCVVRVTVQRVHSIIR